MFTPAGADRGGQVSRVVGWGLVIKSRMRAFGVVAGCPNGDDDTSMGQVAEYSLAEQFIPHPSVDTFDEAVLHRIARRDILPFNPLLGTLRQDGVRSQFRPITPLE